MFQDNLKARRKQMGYSQEQLAIKLNVVRQTVSKWEKGLSVPDVEMLQNIADILEISVSELLDQSLPQTEESNAEVAEQLGRIAEQMAIKNRRAKKIWKTIAIILIAGILVPFVIGVVGIIGYRYVANFNPNAESETSAAEIVSKEYVDMGNVE